MRRARTAHSEDSRSGGAVCHPRPSEESRYTSTKVDLTIRRRLDEFNNESTELVDRASVQSMKNRRVGLKDGRSVLLRHLSADDKQRLLSFVNALSDQALLWGSPPYDEAKIDRWMSGVGKGLSLVATDDDRIVGIAGIHAPSAPRARGIGGMMIYIHQDFHGVGLGTAMTEHLLTLAKDIGLHRVGLEVVEDNEAAVHLYRKLGFRIEGTMIDAYYGADRKYHNMLTMGKIL